MRRAILGLVVFAALAFSGCGDEKGNQCRVDDECGGSLICAKRSICGPEGCAGVCSDPCDMDEDCSGTESCDMEPGTGRGFCRNFDVPGTEPDGTR